MAAMHASRTLNASPTLAIKPRGRKKSKRGAKRAWGKSSGAQGSIRYECSDSCGPLAPVSAGFGGSFDGVRVGEYGRLRQMDSDENVREFLRACMDFERAILNGSGGTGSQGVGGNMGEGWEAAKSHRALQLENQRLQEELHHLKSILVVKGEPDGGAGDARAVVKDEFVDLSVDLGASRQGMLLAGGSSVMPRPQSAVSSSSQPHMHERQVPAPSVPRRTRSAEPPCRRRGRRGRRSSPSHKLRAARAGSPTSRSSRSSLSPPSRALSPVGSVGSTSMRMTRALTPFEVDAMRIVKSQTRHLEWYGVGASEPIPMSERSRRFAREQGGRPASRERILTGSPSPAARQRLGRSFQKYDEMMSERHFSYTMPESSRAIIEHNGLAQVLQEQPAAERLSSPSPHQMLRRHRLHQSIIEEREHQRAPPVWFRGQGTQSGLHPESLSAKIADKYEGTNASAKHRILYNVPVGRSARWRRQREEQEALYARKGCLQKTFITDKSKALEKSIEEETGQVRRIVKLRAKDSNEGRLIFTQRCYVLQTAWRRIILGESTASSKARLQRNMSLWRVDFK